MNRWMNLRRRRRQWAGTVTVTSLPNMQKRTNERRNERLHGQTAVQAKRANTHMHTLLTLPFLCVSACGSAWESKSSLQLQQRRLRREFEFGFEFFRHVVFATSAESQLNSPASTEAATSAQATLAQPAWRAAERRAARQQSGFGSAACNSLAFNCLGVASHDHYLSAAQLHYEQRVCVWVRECDRITTSRWQICDKENLSLSIKLFNLPNENASRQCWTLYPFPSPLFPLPLSVHQLSDRRRFKVLFIVYILSLAFPGNIFIYLFVSQYLRVLHLNEFTSERERDR